MLMQTLEIAKPYNTALHFFLLVNSWKGNIVNNEPHKCEEINFFPLNKLPQNITNYTQKILHNLSNPSEHKFFEYLENFI